MLRLALFINGAAVIWVLIFLEYTYLGIVIGVSALVWFFVFLKKKQDALEENFQKKYADKKIRYLDKKAVLKAQESNGYSQTQGMGYLVLTDDTLDFEMSLFNKAVSISVGAIVAVEPVKRLLGVSTVTPMLKVQFKDHHGNMDAIALSVNALDTWKNEITAAMRAHTDQDH